MPPPHATAGGPRTENGLAHCDTPAKKSFATARIWLRLEMSRRRGMIPVTNGSIGGVAIVATMNAVQIAAGRSGSVHPAINAVSVIGACIVRRRLSIIFQRPSDGIEDRLSRGGGGAASVLEPCPRPNTHG